MTTKYQRPSGSYAGDAALSNRDKYQQDSLAQPRIAISSSKMDGDVNYVVDALNTIDEASGTKATIDERISVALNDDGSLKASVTAALDEWIVHSLTNIIRVDNSTITCEGDQTGIYKAGRRVKLVVSGADVYADVASSSYSAPTSTITFVDLVDSAGVAQIISVVPTVVNYSPLTTGFAGNSSKQYPELKVRGAASVVRVKDTAGSASEFGLRSNGGKLEIVENTGTEISPTWTVRTDVDTNGIRLEDGSVTLAKMAHGTANKLVGFNGSGVPNEVDVGTAASNIVQLDTGAKLPAIDGSQLTNLPAAGGTTPAFHARMIGTVAMTSANTEYKLQCNSEEFDSDGDYDAVTNHRFTPQTAGKYYIYASAGVNASDQNKITIRVKKNGVRIGDFIQTAGKTEDYCISAALIETMNGSTDYVEIFVMVNQASKTLGLGDANWFGAFKVAD